MDGFEIFLWVCGFVVAGVIILGAIGGIMWYRTPANQYVCKLVSIKHFDSTEQSSAVPVMTGNGNVGVGVATSGNPESHTTVWDCGTLGRLVSDNAEVFRWAKPTSTLWIKVIDDEARIVGIEK